MIFVNLLLFILVGVGITNLVVSASILDNLRDFVISKSEFLEKLLTCMMCSGFWVGCFISIFEPNIGIIAGGSIVSLTSYIIGTILDLFNVLIAVKSMELEDEEDE
jgi:hypothetical protein